ncbi:NifU family protein [Tessaracoccus sp. Z1128]
MATQQLLEIEAVLDARVRPALRQHGGAIEIEALDEAGVLGVRLLGACVGCPAADLSMQQLVREELLGVVTGLSDVVLVGSVSDDLLGQARHLLQRGSRRVPLRLTARTGCDIRKEERRWTGAATTARI